MSDEKAQPKQRDPRGELWTPTGTRRTHYTIRERKNRHGTTRYCLTWHDTDTHKRTRQWFKTEAEASAELNNHLNAAYGCEGGTFQRETWLSQEQVDAAASALALLDTYYAPINAKIKSAADARRAAGEKHVVANLLGGSHEIYEAVKVYIAYLKDQEQRSRYTDTLEKLIADFLLDKESSGRRERTVNNLKQRLEHFLETLSSGTLASDVTTEQCECWYNRNRDLVSKRNDRAVLSTLFNWGMRKKRVTANPIDQTESIKLTPSEPKVLTVDECKRLLTYARDSHDGVLLPYITLSLFCGLRSAEASRLDWGAIKLDQRLITIGGDVAKLRGRRTVEIPENAVTWFQLCKNKPIVAPRRVLDTCKFAAGYASRDMEANGLPRWPANVLRHTAISYRLEQTGDEGRTAKWAGNSPAVVHTFYKGLVTPVDSAAFWLLTPATI